MDVYTTEEEQIAKIKEWFKNYGTTVFISILIVVAGTLGWRYWQSHQEKVLTQASVGYEQMMLSLYSNDNKQAKLQAEYLVKQFHSTGYAQVANLALARIAVDDKELKQAYHYLQFVIDNATSPAIKQIAKVRQARVLLAENKPKLALALLQKVDNSAYIALIEMTKGDVYQHLKQVEKAKSAYQTALSTLTKIDINRPLLQMKLDNLAANNQQSKNHNTNKSMTNKAAAGENS